MNSILIEMMTNLVAYCVSIGCVLIIIKACKEI